MALKKVLICLLILGNTSLALAHAKQSFFSKLDKGIDRIEEHFFVDGYAGSGIVKWSKFNANGVIGIPSKSFYAPDAGSDAAGGFDVGYSFSSHFALELGWMHLPTAYGSFTTLGKINGANNTTAIIYSWTSYLGTKFVVPLFKKVNLFGKLGGQYHYLKTEISNKNPELSQAIGHGEYWSPFFALGIETFQGQWHLGFQYFHLPENTKINKRLTGVMENMGAPNAAPAANLYTIFVGYHLGIL